MKTNYEEKLLELINTSSPDAFKMTNAQIKDRIDGISEYQINKCLRSLVKKQLITKATSKTFDDVSGIWNNKRIIYSIN